MSDKELEETQILIAEPESELLLLFREYLSSLEMCIKTASSGHEAINHFLNSKKNGRSLMLLC